MEIRITPRIARRLLRNLKPLQRKLRPLVFEALKMKLDKLAA
jgi:hypothetical protein